jgi:2-polyprenyl-6-hydroxyphenyl methylase/3-demethylubiquinone-9 3-methyltransferase
MTSTFEQEVNRARFRFTFGENWRRFLSVLNDERIAEAEKSLKQMLEVEDLQGKSLFGYWFWQWFILPCGPSIGSKSPFLDYDPQSVVVHKNSNVDTY